MDLKTFLKDPPKLHCDVSGNQISWGLEDGILEFIYNRVNSKSITLETGAGLSTVVFAILQTDHTCIVPSSKEIQKIKKYCYQNNISVKKINFINSISEKFLPNISKDGFDLVLIDGRHAFPTPFIDWYYTAPKLKISGFMIVDDTPLWTGRVLKNFLLSEPEWVLEADFAKSVVFKKIKDGVHDKEWYRQPYVLRNSTMEMRKEKIRYAMNLLLTGKFHILLNKISNEIKLTK